VTVHRERRHRLEAARLRPPVSVVGRRDAILAEQRMRLPQRDEPFRIGERKRPQQHRMSHAEDRRVRANGKRQREYREHGMSRCR
jgi:hypothetical protein